MNNYLSALIADMIDEVKYSLLVLNGVLYLYRLKGLICEYFEWYRKDFDPKTESYYLYDANSGKSLDGEITSYWIERYFVGRGLFSNWWYSYRWDTSN